jgi:hypothetical protein
VHFFFGILAVLNSLGIGFFYFFPRIFNATVVSPTVDVRIWLASAMVATVLGIFFTSAAQRAKQLLLALVTSVLGIALLLAPTGIIDEFLRALLFGVVTLAFLCTIKWSQFAIGRPMRGIVLTVAGYFLMFILSIEGSSAVHYVALAFDPHTQVGALDSVLEMQLDYVTYGLIPVLYSLFIFSWLWMPLAHLLRVKARSVRHAMRSISFSQSLMRYTSHASFSAKSNHRDFFDWRFFAVLALAVFIGDYPYLSGAQWIVGTDAYTAYYLPLLKMNSSSLSQSLGIALSQKDHLALIILYAVELISRVPPSVLVQLLPTFLVILFAFSGFFFLNGRKMTDFGVLCLLLCVLSVTTAVGTYTGIFANWMALVACLIFFGVARQLDKEIRLGDGLILLLISTFILLVHPWTWGLFALTIVLAVALSLTQAPHRFTRESLGLVVILGVDALIAFAVPGWGWANALGVYGRAVQSLSRITVFWTALVSLIHVWAPFFNPLYLAVSILGYFTILRVEGPNSWRRRFIMAMVCVSGVASVFAAPVGFNPSQFPSAVGDLWRILFLTPFYLTAPFGVVTLTNIVGQLVRKTQNHDGGLAKNFIMIVLGASVIIAWGPEVLRVLILLVLLPIATGFALEKGLVTERDIIILEFLAVLLLVFFTSTARALSQLLLDPHSFRGS